MKNFYIFLIFSFFFFPFYLIAADYTGSPTNVKIERNEDTAIISWKNTEDGNFSKTILFRSAIPIADYFTYEAVDGLCDKLYEGKQEIYIDSDLAINLPYYYILFSEDNSGNHSKAIVIEKPEISKKNDTSSEEKDQNTENNENRSVKNLAGASSNIVNQISLEEAAIIYNYNDVLNVKPGDESNRLALFILVKSPHSLNDQEKRAISYFIHEGTPTTILLGTGERAGVLNSYLSVFDKLPRNVPEWQDVIKIANGRWPEERSLTSEENASNVHFQTIYKRLPNMDNPNDNAAVTVIAYGLRPANRNMESEKNAIKIYRSIFDKDPVEATDWDLVRAIAYSGASR